MKLTDQAKNALLNTINDQGFVLEHRLHSLLKRHFPASQPRRGEVVFFNDVRREFDSILEMGSANFIFECKRSVFDFFFLAPADYPSHLHIIKHYVDPSSQKPLGIYTLNARPSWQIKTCADSVEVSVDSQGIVSTKKYDKGHLFGAEYALTSNRDDYIRNKAKQVIANTEALIWKKMGLNADKPNLNQTAGQLFFPVIVTNANLFYLKYSDENVSEEGSLIDFANPVPVKYLACNFSENMRWGDRLKDVEYFVDNELGNPSQDYRGSHLKSVFVVNIGYVKEFVEAVREQVKGVSDELDSLPSKYQLIDTAAQGKDQKRAKNTPAAPQPVK
jgi:hypothetical protein